MEVALNGCYQEWLTAEMTQGRFLGLQGLDLRLLDPRLALEHLL